MGPQVRHPAARRRAGARHLAGHLLLRARRAAHALGLRQRPSVRPLPSRRGGARSARPGARAHDRLSRLRRERRRAPRRLRRLRPRRPAGRHGSRARDEGAAPPRRGDRHRRPDARPGTRRRAVRALPDLRRLPLPGSRVRVAARGQAAVGRRLAAAPRRARRRAARGDRPRGRAVRLPQQARVLVHADRERPCARLPPRRPLGRGARDRPLLPDDRPRQRDQRSHARVGPRGAARRLRPGRRRRATSGISSCARAGTPARRSCSS